MSPLLISICAGIATTALGVGGTLYYRGELKDCELSKALEANKAQEIVAAAKARDEVFTRGLEEQLSPIVNAIKEQGNATQIALAKVKSDPNCVRTPAATAFDRVVQPTGGGQARPDATRPAKP